MPFHIQPLREFLVRPSLPDSLSRLTELAYNIVWSWEPIIRSLFRRLDPVIWRECGYNPVLMLGRVSQATLQKAVHRSALPGALSFRLCHLRCARAQGSRAGRWQTDRLFLRRVRPHRVPAGLFGRPRHPLRRSFEVFQRPGLSADRPRPALPAGLLPPASESRRMAAGTLSDERLLHPAAGNRERRRRPRSQGLRQAAHRQRLHSDLEARRRPHHALPAGHQHPRKRPAAGSRHHRFPLRRRHRHPHPPGNRARHRRHARLAGDGARSPPCST